MESLYHKLKNYSEDNYYPMHMPGHKRNDEILSMMNPYRIDITEIDGFDNLHNAEDILKDAMNRCERLYGSKHTNFLVNGSTVGILAAVATCTESGDAILVARNCHKAVYNAIFLNQLKPIYIYPHQEQKFGINGGINPKKVKELLIKHQNIKAVVVTSPTYEGIISNIEEIVTVCHSFQVPVIVDEAHGAHFGFHKGFPTTSITTGADIVIHSVHKTLPSLTQTALIHVNSNIVNYQDVTKYLSIYQSSSPSYLLLASIDSCMELLEREGEELFNQYKNRLTEFHSNINLKKLALLDKYIVGSDEIFDLDPSKIVISTKGLSLTGYKLYKILLDDYKIQLEMASYDYVIAMTSICDTKEGFTRLKMALEEIDKNLENSKKEVNNEIENEIENEIDKKVSVQVDRLIDHEIHDINNKNSVANVNLNKINDLLFLKFTPYEASKKETVTIPLSKSNNEISAEYIYLYPPGIPIIVPGEVIHDRLIKMIIEYKEMGLNVVGSEDKTLRNIKVVKEVS